MNSRRNDTGKGPRRSRRARRTLRRLVIAALAALGIAGVAAFYFGDREGGASPQQIAQATGTLTAGRTFYDFGQVSMKDGKVSTRFGLRNEGDAPALVVQVFTSCMCTEASLLIGSERLGPFGMQGHSASPRLDRVIAPGEEAIVEAVFDPNAHGPAGVGRNDRAVSLLLGGRRVLQLQFTAYVTP